MKYGRLIGSARTIRKDRRRLLQLVLLMLVLALIGEGDIFDEWQLDPANRISGNGNGLNLSMLMLLNNEGFEGVRNACYLCCIITLYCRRS